ncbi:MAG TPA: hypothetical protein RWN64_09075 [Ruminococcus sp.]|nr:hypothetical protein [Ruminococcus sp.]
MYERCISGWNLQTSVSLALLLVGAATLPELFDSIKLQYQLTLNFFGLESAGMVLVRGVKDKGDIKKTKTLSCTDNTQKSG